MRIDVVLHKIDDIITEFATESAWGNVEIEFQNGAPVRIRKSKIEKLPATENNRAKNTMQRGI